MDHNQTLFLDRLSELEEPIVSGIDQCLVELESSKKNLKDSLQFYYNQMKDRQDVKEYYHSLPLHEGNQNLFHPFHQLLKKTHRPLPYFVSKDLYLYPWVDLQLDGSIKNIYELVENTRDFSHEMNRLRIGHGLCHVNYLTYVQSKVCKKVDRMVIKLD